MRLQCPQCGNVVEAAPGTQAVCPRCGYSAPVPNAPPSAPTYVPYPAPAPPGYGAPETMAPPPQWGHGPARPPVTQGVAIAALLLNILTIPGIGSLVGGRIKEGIAQLVLMAVGLVLLIILVGIFLWIAAWIWGLVTGIQLVQSAEAAPRAG